MTLACPLTAFPKQGSLNADPYTPSPLRFACETRPGFNDPVNPTQCPEPVTTKTRQVPRAPLPTKRGYLVWGDVSHHLLPLPHRSYGPMRQTKSLPPPTVDALVGGSLQVAVSPC